MLYSFGGYDDDDGQPPINALNTYNIFSGEWSNVSVSGGDFNYASRGATSRAISTGSSEALGFVAGGWVDLGGMIRFDASDPANPQWRNETDNNPPLSLEGDMNFIRLGPRGSLIEFGGYIKDASDPNWNWDRRPMNQINVYDIESATWYNVTANGDVPDVRSAFCTAVSSAPDDSSFQITMYAGWDLFGAKAYADTYVLSIPSFQWINVTGASNSDARLAEGSGWSGRDHHSCVAYKDREMLVLGGILKIGSKEQNLGQCNDEYPATRALDLSTFEWKQRWDGNPPAYFVPDAVTRIIGGNGQGGAEMKSPPGGFNDSALNTNFASVLPRYTPPSITLASSDPNSNGEDSDSNNGNSDGISPPSSETNVGAIAGGVVGGVAALALIAAIIFLLRRRSRKQIAAAGAPAPPPYPPQTGIAYDGKPIEMSNDGAKLVGGRGGGGYELVPSTQEMDTGYRGSEVESEPGPGAGAGFGFGYAGGGNGRRSELPG